MSYTASNDIFDAISGQIANQLSGEIDDVVIFDGDLDAAIEQHLNTAGLGDATIFVGMPETGAERLDGCGLPLRETLSVDIYVIVRAKGRSGYRANRERLWDLSDRLVHSVFTCNNRQSDFTDIIYGWRFSRRVRMTPATPDYFAHRIEFTTEGALT